MEKKPALTREERRARKQERRDKQRLANVGRAKKMHQLRLSAEKQLAPVGARKVQPPKETQHHVGCSGWFY
jgi:hypothetical protein